MSLVLTTADALTSLTRDSGATYINSAGKMVGVDWATTSSQAASSGSKTFSVGSDRGWAVGMGVRITPRDGTSNILMVGTVTDYNNSSGVLTVNVTSTGSDTTTTKTLWRIGYTGKRLDYSNFHDFVFIERAGYLVEAEPRTNSILNGDFIGSVNGVIGSGGGYPTGVSTSVSAAMVFEIVGSGVDIDTGLSYFDLRISGTRSGANAPAINLSSTTSIPAAPGQAWVLSGFVSVVAGSMTNINSIQLATSERNSGGTFLNNTNGIVGFSPTGALTRYQKMKTIVAGTVAYISPSLIVNVPNGSSCDITLRISSVQLEKIREPFRTGTCQAGSTSTTVVLDAGASSVDDYYNGLSIVISGGTGVSQNNTITDYDGTTKTATVSAWTTTPDATSTFAIYTTDTGIAASSYIPTRQVAETRQPDLLNAASFGTWFTLSTEGTLLVEALNPAGRDVLQSPDPTYGVLWQDSNNFVRLNRTAPLGTLSGAQVKKSGNDQAVLNGGAFNNSVVGVCAVAFKNNDVKLSFTGEDAVVSTSTPDGVPVPTELRLGRLNDSAPNGAFMGWLRKVRYIPRSLSATELKALTAGTL